MLNKLSNAVDTVMYINRNINGQKDFNMIIYAFIPMN